MSGLVHDLDEQEYHRNPALSASGAKRLLPPGCPALFKWEREHGQVAKAAFDFGRAAHAHVLGAGADLEVGPYDDYRSKAAQAWRDEVRADGVTPLLRHEYDVVLAMRDAIRAHPIAAALLDAEHGKPEISAFWADTERGVDRRVRFDWLPDTDGGRLIVPDFKTTVSAEPGSFARSVFNFGYALQAVFYMDAVRALELAEDVAFVFIAQEKTAPYLVTVYELDDASLAIGREQVDQACSVFKDCTETDTWPGYSNDVELITPPAWLARQYGAAA